MVDDAARRRALYFHVMQRMERMIKSRVPDATSAQDGWERLSDQDREELEALAFMDATTIEVARQVSEVPQDDEEPAERPALVN